MKKTIKFFFYFVLSFFLIASVVGALLYIVIVVINKVDLKRLFSQSINDEETQDFASISPVDENMELESVVGGEETPLIAPIPNKAPSPGKRLKKSNIYVPRKAAKLNSSLNERQNKLLNFISDNKEVSMYDITTVFNKVTQRTLRRDLERLEGKGLVSQQGKTRNSVYKLI